jgi:rRNA maturation endonuclease Nob1
MMPECEGCGASVDRGMRECPYCGHVLLKIVTDHSKLQESREVYSLDLESGTIHFGDGKLGAIPKSGKDSISAAYRIGGGTKGNLVCSNCKHQNPVNLLRCKACGSDLHRRKLHRGRKVR